MQIWVIVITRLSQTIFIVVVNYIPPRGGGVPRTPGSGIGIDSGPDKIFPKSEFRVPFTASEEHKVLNSISNMVGPTVVFGHG